MANVKDVLSRNKLPKDYPPTMLDVKTRDKHVPESVRYNMKHFRDHGDNAIKQIEKEEQTNPAAAKRLAHEALKTVESVAKDLKRYC